MSPTAGATCPALVDIIQFKWLMSRQGRHVHVERLQSDRGYALACIAEAQQCNDAALATSARRLASQLGA